MKQVWQCDYCNETSLHHKIMEEHENGCVFNPINHSCHSCLYALEDNYISGTSGCEKKNWIFLIMKYMVTVVVGIIKINQN